MKIYKIIANIFAVALLAMVTVGCGGGDDSGDTGGTDAVDYASQVHSIDFSGAQGLYITGDDLGSSSPAPLYAKAPDASSIQKAAAQVDLDPNSLYMITADGTLQRIMVTDDNGNELPRAAVRPTSIVDINSQYLFMWLTIGDGPIPYLIHKTTGLAYNATGIPMDESTDIQWDEANNLYLQNTHNPGFYMIDTSSLGSSSLSAIEIQTPYNPYSWIVDPKGNFILFSDGQGGEDTRKPYYLSLTDGSLANLNFDIPKTFEIAWIRGLDNKIYAYDKDSSMAEYTLYHIDSDSNGGPLVTEIAKTDIPAAHWTIHPDGRYVISGRLLYFADMEYGNFTVNEIDTTNAKVHNHTNIIDNNMTVNKFLVSNDFIYCFGPFKDTLANGVYRYNPVTRTGIRTTVDQGFDVQKFSLLPSGQFLVEGIRLSDLAYFYGELSAENGTITVTSTVSIGEPLNIILEVIKPTDFMLIDGDANDWPTTMRVLSDTLYDNTSTDGDLSFYSETTTTSQYFGMIEHVSTLDRAYYVNIIFDNDYTLQLIDNNATLFDATDTEVDTLTNLGGTSSRGSVIEFSLPLSETGGSTNVISVELFGQTTTGDINSTDSIDLIN